MAIGRILTPPYDLEGNIRALFQVGPAPAGTYGSPKAPPKPPGEPKKKRKHRAPAPEPSAAALAAQHKAKRERLTKKLTSAGKGKKEMKWLIRVAVVTASMLAWPDVTSACICPGYRMPSSPTAYRQWLASFDGAVFRGTVVSVRTVPTVAGREALLTAEYTFKVERVWKGVTTSEVVIRTAADASMCGIPFVRAKAYLIAADAPRQTIGLCSIGYELARNEKDFLSALGEGSQPPK